MTHLPHRGRFEVSSEHVLKTTGRPPRHDLVKPKHGHDLGRTESALIWPAGRRLKAGQAAQRHRRLAVCSAASTGLRPV
jgi:hypothetical protein